MAVLPILEYPDPRLRKKAVAVDLVDATIRRIVDDMFETMYDAPGVGLAATQVNIHKRIIVIDVSDEKDSPVCLINPEIVETSGEIENEEGCLSVPGIFEMVERPELVKINALGRDGKKFELETDGLLATCIQHEIDHLQGKVFVDYLSNFKQQRIKKKLEKQHRLAARDKQTRTTPASARSL
ncbi:MAG TPA: peptide deformylase [Crenotrichaceae bacterium]|nr:peptide deformylase [Crenotrichaceae bacterium]